MVRMTKKMAAAVCIYIHIYRHISIPHKGKGSNARPSPLWVLMRPWGRSRIQARSAAVVKIGNTGHDDSDRKGRIHDRYRNETNAM